MALYVEKKDKPTVLESDVLSILTLAPMKCELPTFTSRGGSNYMGVCETSKITDDFIQKIHRSGSIYSLPNDKSIVFLKDVQILLHDNYIPKITTIEEVNAILDIRNIYYASYNKNDELVSMYRCFYIYSDDRNDMVEVKMTTSMSPCIIDDKINYSIGCFSNQVYLLAAKNEDSCSPFNYTYKRIYFGDDGYSLWKECIDKITKYTLQ